MSIVRWEPFSGMDEMFNRFPGFFGRWPKFAADPEAKFDWAPAVRNSAATPDDASAGPTLFDAVETQLGLKLERKMLALPVIVVDAVERTPIEN